MKIRISILIIIILSNCNILLSQKESKYYKQLNINHKIIKPINIEQKAFDYFTIILDSLWFVNTSSYKFNRFKDTLFFNKKTESYIALNFNINHSSKKNNFIVIDSTVDLKNDPWIYPISKQTKRIQTVNSRLTIKTYHERKLNLHSNNIRITMTNRFYHLDYYYVAINIYTSIKNIHYTIYIKLDLLGNPIDYAEFKGIS